MHRSLPEAKGLGHREQHEPVALVLKVRGMSGEWQEVPGTGVHGRGGEESSEAGRWALSQISGAEPLSSWD